MKREHATGLEKRIEELRAENRRVRGELQAARAELEVSRLMLRRREGVYHAVPSVIVVVQEGRVADVNETVQEQLGYAPEEILGRAFLEIVDPDSRPLVREIHARRLARKTVPEQYEAVFLTRDGRPCSCEVRVRKILIRRKRAFVVSLTPMDKRKEREENRLRSKKMEAVLTMASALAVRFGRHCKALSDQVERLNQAVFTAGKGAPLELQALEAVTQETLETADQLRIIARGEMDPSEVRRFDLKPVVKEAVSLGWSAVESRHASEPSRYQVKTYLRSGAQILGKPEALREVIAHLVRNALEAMPGGGDLYVTSEEIGGQLHLTLMDNGMGVSEQVMDRIFDPFFTTRGGEAAGLGLSFAYAVIRRHGGKIEVSSEKGQGTEIRVLLPAAPREAPAGRKRSARRPGRPGKVLVIAPTQALRDLLDRFFHARGWQVVTASSEAEGLGRFQREAYVGIILECRRKARTRAAALCRKIKARDGGVPVTLITDDGVPARNARPGEAPLFDLVIRKPLFMDEFQRRVMRLLSAAAAS